MTAAEGAACMLGMFCCVSFTCTDFLAVFFHYSMFVILNHCAKCYSCVCCFLKCLNT